MAIVNSNPNEIIAALLVGLGQATRPAAAGPWSVTTGNMPDDKDQWISTHNTGPEVAGKFMDDGRPVQHETVQVKLRSRTEGVGHKKLREIARALSGVSNVAVTTTYPETLTVPAVTIVSGPMWLMQEEKNARQVFVLNVKIADPEED